MNKRDHEQQPNGVIRTKKIIEVIVVNPLPKGPKLFAERGFQRWQARAILRRRRSATAVVGSGPIHEKQRSLSGFCLCRDRRPSRPKYAVNRTFRRERHPRSRFSSHKGPARPEKRHRPHQTNCLQAQVANPRAGEFESWWRRPSLRWPLPSRVSNVAAGRSRSREARPELEPSFAQGRQLPVRCAF